MSRLLLGLVGALVVALWIERVRGDRARAGAVRLALVRDSTDAAHDTTREVRVLALNDSVRAFARRAKQQEQRADGLDRALRARRVARVDARVRLVALDTVVRAETVFVANDSVHRSRFRVRQAPFSVEGEVAMNRAGADSVSLHIDVDSIPLQVRINCGRRVETPVRQATVAAVAPPWARVALTEVQQEVGVCNPELVKPRWGARLAGMASRVGVAVGAGAVLGSAGQVVVRPAVVVGLRVWP